MRAWWRMPWPSPGARAVADPAPALAALRTAMGAPAGAADDLLRRLSHEIRAGAHDPGTAAHAAVAQRCWR